MPGDSRDLGSLQSAPSVQLGQAARALENQFAAGKKLHGTHLTLLREEFYAVE
jgi:hypothetical protein